MKYLLILLLAIPTVAQCDRVSDSMERFNAVRLLPPVRIKYADLGRIEWLHDSRNVITTGTLYLDSASVRPADFNRRYKNGKWWVLYSSCDSHVMTIVEVLPSQIR